MEKIIWNVGLKHVGFKIPAGKTEKDYVKDDKSGTLLGYFMQANNPNVLLFMKLHGDDGTVLTHDESILSLLRHGLGLSPGDIGAGLDPHGTPNIFSPWVARYRTDTSADNSGQTGEAYAVAYFPASPPPFTKLVMSIVNQSQNEVTVQHAHVYRLMDA